MGTPQAAVRSLERMIEDGHKVVGVYTQPDRPSGRGNKIAPSPIKEFALRHRMAVYQPIKIRTVEALEQFKSLGADVTGVCSTRNVDLVKSLGADHVIDYTKENFTKGAERYDVMLDNVGNHSLSECKGVLTPAGKYVLIGGGGAGDQGFLGGLGKALWAMVFSKFVNQQMGMMMADANHNDLTILADMMQSGKVKPVIDRTYKSLSDVPDAIRYLEQGHARGKVVVTVE